MTVRSATQLTFDFEPGLATKHPSLLSLIAERVRSQRDPLKTVAGHLDCTQSMLSRKINDDPHQDPDQRRVFNVEDLEKYIGAYHDLSPILYLVEKYMQDNTTRQRQAMAQLEQLMPDLVALVKMAKGGK